MVLVVLLQIGTKDLTVCSAEYEYFFIAVQSRLLIAVLTKLCIELYRKFVKCIADYNCVLHCRLKLYITVQNSILYYTLSVLGRDKGVPEGEAQGNTLMRMVIFDRIS